MATDKLIVIPPKSLTKIKPGRFYIVFNEEVDTVGFKYLKHSVIHTEKVNPKSFASIEAALEYRNKHLKDHAQVVSILSGRDYTYRVERIRYRYHINLAWWVSLHECDLDINLEQDDDDFIEFERLLKEVDRRW